MVYLTVAYGAVWLGVFAYIFKLASDSRRLQEQVNSLEETQKQIQQQMQSAGVNPVGSAD